MNKTTVDFKTGWYFSLPIIFLGSLFFIGGIMLISVKPVGAFILLMLGLIIFTTHYRLSVDFGKKKYSDYLWLLGFKLGSVNSFEKIDYLFITRSRISQTMYLRAVSSSIRKDVFDAYLRFSDDDKVHLVTKNDKDALIRQMRPISAALHVKLVDYSEGASKVIA